jgi:hypothetical protein
MEKNNINKICDLHSSENIILVRKVLVFWEVASCSVVEIYRRFEERTAFILRVRESSKQATPVNMYQTARRHTLDDSTLHSHRRDDLLSSFMPKRLRELHAQSSSFTYMEPDLTKQMLGNRFNFPQEINRPLRLVSFKHSNKKKNLNYFFSYIYVGMSVSSLYNSARLNLFQPNLASW